MREYDETDTSRDAGGYDGIILSSVTYAIRAREILARYAIKGYTLRLPPEITGTGCGYGLRIRGNFYEAVQIINQTGILIKGYFNSYDIS